MRRRAKSVAVTAAACLLTLAGCEGGTRASPNTLRIGLLVEQTGQFSWYGQEAVKGARLYQKLHPRTGKMKIDFITYDTGSDPQKAMTGFRKLVQQDGVSAVAGLGLTNEAGAVAPLAASLKTPLYVLSGNFTPPNHQTFSTPVQITDKVGSEFGELSRRGVKRIALLTTNDATGQIVASLFPKLAAKAGLDLVVKEQMNTTDVDVSPQLTNIEKSKPDLIIAWEIGKPLGVVYNSAHQLAVKTPFMISDGNLAPGFLGSIADKQPSTVYVQATKDVFWKGLADGDPQAPVITEFHSDYVAQEGEEPGLGSAVGHDAVMLLAEAARRAHSNDPAEITSALQSLDNPQGVLGVYHLSTGNHVGLTAADTLLGRVENGKVTPDADTDAAAATTSDSR
ncbi:ABC transporter substrate-binding protein [Streptomyces sp. NPDC050560]|uniref:ABC transporter substrate-binding protein n=1 Tax=Streptomyces sp. NPDC050560 TaxID=3365630 RepID=UPI00378A26EA